MYPSKLPWVGAGYKRERNKRYGSLLINRFLTQYIPHAYIPDWCFYNVTRHFRRETRLAAERNRGNLIWNNTFLNDNVHRRCTVHTGDALSRNDIHIDRKPRRPDFCTKSADYDNYDYGILNKTKTNWTSRLSVQGLFMLCNFSADDVLF